MAGSQARAGFATSVWPVSGGVVGVVGAAGELDEASAAEVGAVGRTLVAELGAVVVEVEGVAAG